MNAARWPAEIRLAKDKRSLTVAFEDGASFELRLVGLSDGRPQVLVDHTGAPVTLRGLYNPDLPVRSLP